MVQVKSGDAHAFRVLSERYRPRLERFAWRLLGDTEDAQDAAQEILLRLWQKASLYRNQGSFDGFVYTLARHICIRQREKQYKTERLDEIPVTATGTTPQWGLAARVAAAVRRLPQQQRLVFILSEYEGLTYEQIAQVLGCPKGTVGSRKYLAVRALTHALLPEETEG